MSSRADVQVVAEPGPVNVATDFSLDDICKLARDTGYVGKGTPQGFYIGTFLDTVSVSLEDGAELTCAKRIRIELYMQLVNRRIEIGRELRQRPCLFSAVLQNYEKKAKADEIAFAQYVDSTAAALRAAPLPAINVSANQPLDETSRTRIEQWVKGLVDRTLESFHAARVAAQEAVDTPEEMKRLKLACTRGI